VHRGPFDGQEEISLTNRPEDTARRADTTFKKEERAREGTKALQEYEAQVRAIQKNTARLRALRLAKEAADKLEEATKPVKLATKNRAARSAP
jgi:hypothetical protein